MAVHQFFLFPYVIGMAQPARPHGHDFLPCGLVFAITGPQGVRQQVGIAAVNAASGGYGTEVGFPLRRGLYAGQDRPVDLFFEIVGELPARRIGVETDMLTGGTGTGDYASHLLHGRCPAGGDEHGLPQVPVVLLVQLVVGHGVIAAFEPEYMGGISQGCPGRTADPQTRTRIASLGLALVAAAAVHPGTAAFLESHDLVRFFGQAERKGKVGVALAVRTVPGRQTEIPVKGILGVQVDAPVLEEKVEFLLRIPVLRVEPVDVIVLYVEGPGVPPGLYDACLPVWDGLVQQPVAHEVHQPVAGHARPVFRKKLRMFLDEGDDVVQFLVGRLEAALAFGRDDELVAAHTPAVAVCPDV